MSQSVTTQPPSPRRCLTRIVIRCVVLLCTHCSAVEIKYRSNMNDIFNKVTFTMICVKINSVFLHLTVLFTSTLLPELILITQYLDYFIPVPSYYPGSCIIRTSCRLWKVYPVFAIRSLASFISAPLKVPCRLRLVLLPGFDPYYFFTIMDYSSSLLAICALSLLWFVHRLCWQQCLALPHLITRDVLRTPRQLSN